MSDPSRVYQQFFAELKRRKVFRVMAVYGATAFVVLQVADLLAEGMGLSDQVLRITTFLVLIGFPIAIVLAWAFETTPDGVRRTEDATDEEIEAIIAQPAGRRWSAGLLALAGATLLFGGWWLGQRGSADPGLNLAPAGAEAAGFPRVAVLPFDDLGGTEENDPLVRGSHIEIIDKLSTLGDLVVIQPASVFSYASSQKDPSVIAEELVDVDYLVQGSVVRSGSQARINVILLDLATDEPAPIVNWSGTITADSVISIQSQIARRVAERLEARLSPQDIERLEAGLSTTSPDAINAYHRARAIWFSKGAPKDLDTMEGHLERAVELAPEFVEAWAFLARVLSFRAFQDESLRERSIRAGEAVERTESLAPGSLEAVTARGWYTYYIENDFERALELMREAERRAPSDADVLSAIGWIQHRLGEFAAGNRMIKRAADLDPQNAGRLWELAGALGRVAKWDAADDVLERALAIDPSNQLAKLAKVSLTVHRDRDPARGRRVAAEFGLDDTDYPDGFSYLALLERDYDQAIQILAYASDDESGSTARQRINRLARSILVEELRGGDSVRLRDSLAPFLAADSAGTSGSKAVDAVARILTGREEAGFALLAEFVDEARSSKDEAASIGNLWVAARVYAWFGRTEEALALLDEAVARPSDGWHSAAELQLDPRFDSLREDPRFDDLLARQEAYEAAQAREAETEDWLP